MTYVGPGGLGANGTPRHSLSSFLGNRIILAFIALQRGFNKTDYQLGSIVVFATELK